MKPSDEQIKELLGWFVNASETKKKYSEPRRKALEENHKWVQPTIIEKMSDDEIEAKFLEYYNTGGGMGHANGMKQSLNAIYRDRIFRDKNRFKQTISHLFDEKTNIKDRVDNVLSGQYHVEGFGRALTTSFLMDFNPDKYCLWNGKTEMGFSVIEWPIYDSKDSKGTKYLKILEALKKLIFIGHEYKLDFIDIDLFLHTISAEDEGKKVVKTVTGEDIETIIESGEQISKEVQNMEITMEKYLEEFIEANFDKIKFGANLELYQDEESSGRQYRTIIGNIDLLSVDREKKKIVVIELKKGRTSDVVVGQVLRYMGWVKENLIKDEYQDYDVMGMIIAKEKDVRLEYALKLMPTVNLFLYTVTFDVKKII